MKDTTEGQSQTRGEFCQTERISKSVFYELKKRGLAPDELEIPGTTIKRITPAARAAWRERMAELAKGEAAQLEAERRRALTAVAGRIAAASPAHVSRRGPRTAKRRAVRR